METIQADTKEVVATHESVCDFFLVDKSDDLRKSSVDFFGMWREFFKQIDAALPKEDKRTLKPGAKKAGSGGQQDQ